MKIRPIRTEADYKAALTIVSRLVELDPAIDTPEGEQLDKLTTLIQAYEMKDIYAQIHRHTKARKLLPKKQAYSIHRDLLYFTSKIRLLAQEGKYIHPFPIPLDSSIVALSKDITQSKA